MMGETQAAIVVACLLQRSSAIQSAGGYLRELTRKAGEGSSRSDRFSWPKLTPRTASGDPPEGMVGLQFFAADHPLFPIGPSAEGSSGLIRTAHDNVRDGVDSRFRISMRDWTLSHDLSGLN